MKITNPAVVEQIRADHAADNARVAARRSPVPADTAEFIVEMEAAASQGDHWGWRDRRHLDGTIRVITGPYAGQVMAPSDEWEA